jgi:NAD(P)-dependent dehydrogenase (short-subunit alcohol dehydrogenase family)
MHAYLGTDESTKFRTINSDPKVIVVIGGAGLIGGEFVECLSALGHQVILADIDLIAARARLDQLKLRDSEKIDILKIDITNEKSIISLIEGVKKKYGVIDAVVNCAYPKNAGYGNKLEQVSYEDFCENINIHLGGYFLVSKLFCMAFCKWGGGNVINLASIYGEVTPNFGIYKNTTMTMPIEYAAIKSALIHMTKYFAEYFKGNNIRLNCLSPGGIFAGQPREFLEAYNRQCNSKGMLNPGDLLGALVFLLSDGSKYITGQNLIIDDGWSI